jgi:hypothetical protein
MEDESGVEGAKRPRLPRRFSAGTAQSVNESARVSEAFQPILWTGPEIS